MQSKAGSAAATPLSAQTEDGKKGKFSWPSMPGIKPQLGGKRDSLQPIGRSRSPRHSVTSPVVPSSAASPTGVQFNRHFEFWAPNWAPNWATFWA